MNEKVVPYVPRALQLDSKQLDEEFYSILASKIFKSLSPFESRILVRLEPEIKTLLKIFLLHFTLQYNGQTVGQALLDIRYDARTSKKRLSLYSTTAIFLTWLKLRQNTILNFISIETLREKIWKILHYFEIYLQSLELVNLIVFILKGNYPSVLERLFRLKMVPKSNSSHSISYSYFTRELLWNGFSDLLSFVLPLISYDQFHNFIKMLLPSHGKSLENEEEDEEEISLDTYDLHCVVCKELATLPQVYGCKHVTCYYCIFSPLSSKGTFQCPLCDHEVFAPEKVESLALKFRTSD